MRSRPGRSGRSARSRPWLSAATVLAVAVLAACSGGGGTADSPPVTTSGTAGGATERSTPPGSPAVTNDPDVPTMSMPTQDRTLPAFTDGVGMAEWLPFGVLDVRALDYREDGVEGARDSRIDVVTVEECGDSGSMLLRHTTWHLVDASGRTLGAAGGKVVGGHPTEDIPRLLSRGSCLQTDLAIGVPRGSTPVAVKDGPHNTWVLAD